MGQTDAAASRASFPKVQVDSLYYTGKLNKRWCSYLLAEEPGRWVLARSSGSPLWSSKGHFWMPGGPDLQIYPRGEWFNIYYLFDGEGALSYYYINVTMPPQLAGGRLTFVDLDLDLGVNRDLSYTIYDEDEFLSHCDMWRYPREVCERARATLDDLIARAARHDPIFDEWERYWPRVPRHFIEGVSAAMTPPHGEHEPVPPRRSAG